MPTSHHPPEKMMFQLTLRRRGISDQAVLRAMEEIPREDFVEPADRDGAYRDSALGIACGQTISQPFVVAYMVMLGDGFDIPASAGTFDRIIVTAAMEQIPEALIERLEPGGILIAPVGPHRGTQTLVRLTRTEAGFDRRELVDVRFVPALPGIAREL